MKRRSSRSKESKDEIIDLTDTSGNNTMPVVRELETNPITGCVTMRSITDPDRKNNAFDSPMQVIEEDKGQGFNNEPYTPLDPEPEADERLEMEGAQIINSTTYYPASNTTITKKSQTPAEIAEERGYQNFVER